MDYDERSAGGIVFKKSDGQIKWLLIKTANFRRGNDRNYQPQKKAVFKFPKGHLQKDEFLKEAALREVEEEGRVKTRIVAKIGSNNYFISDKLTKKKIVKKVTFFLMEYVGDSELRHFDKEMVIDRQWLDYETALELLAYDSEKTLLRKTRQKLESL
ncbi:MAG: NUDIX domain-containing protein [Candidatus Shapirobacteria bacterium]|jgi:ADP-ribose pyrophosphatase YjhB (NUDIX family)